MDTTKETMYKPQFLATPVVAIFNMAAAYGTYSFIARMYQKRYAATKTIQIEAGMKENIIITRKKRTETCRDPRARIARNGRRKIPPNGIFCKKKNIIIITRKKLRTETWRETRTLAFAYRGMKLPIETNGIMIDVRAAMIMGTMEEESGFDFMGAFASAFPSSWSKSNDPKHIARNNTTAK